MRCNVCKQKMIETDGNSDYHAYLCNNWHCRMFAQPGIYRAKNPGKEAKQRFCKSGSSYEQYKDQKRDNYRLLRNIDIEPKVASLMSSSNKKTEATLSSKGR